MIIYKSDVQGFKNAVDNNAIVSDIEKGFNEKFGRKVNNNEKRSWNNSLRFMETALRKAELPGDCGVLVEYNIPSTSKRIDFIVTGHNDKDEANFVIIELKQWESAQSTEKEELVATFLGGAIRDVPHPSYQAYSYKKYITDMNEAVYTKNIQSYSCAYLHNYNIREPEPLLSPQYSEIIEDTPIFFSRDVNRLEAFMKKYVGKGRGKEILYQIENGKIKPSKKFVEYITSMFQGNQVYTLLDEQQVAYANIIEHAMNGDSKKTIIINGGPGTGKSVVAMNAFVRLLNEDMNIQFVAPNASFKEALITSLSGERKYTKKRLNAIFSGSGRFYDALDDEFDMLIVDEAHRLKGKGTYMYKGESQVDDVIRSSKRNVFFVDDFQRIRPNDEGTVEKIMEIASNYNSEVIKIDLIAQFRCAGAEGFLNWIEHTLGLSDTANFDGWDQKTFEFKLVDDPNHLKELIDHKNEQGFKARMLAGYAWNWTSEKEGNSNAEIHDIIIDEYNFSMPWNSRNNSYSWAVDPDKADQIGCIHTSQGLEFDYIGVIIGNDLKYDPVSMEVHGSYDNYKDAAGKKGLKAKPDELTNYIKNIYRVLLSRGMKGCYVFCQDQNLRDYFESRLLMNQGNL
ncbi:DUF2075 domain-containing protein [Proteiniclasticum sp.]|uniref:DUF2075 domain-containing protein n=1 Tax=Proteiniclasticum sp. TaxID=2053595 RepID=UPI00289B18E2|nr:DUF2075 domain-containing protein [Proteiniclasticum sp.]